MLVPQSGELDELVAPVGLEAVNVSMQAPVVDVTWVTKLVKSSLGKTILSDSFATLVNQLLIDIVYGWIGEIFRLTLP